MQLESTNVDRLKHALDGGLPITDALPRTIGGTVVCDGLWRFYSDSWPQGGIQRWNSSSQWKQNWSEFLPAGGIAFGEDVFGNQLMIVAGKAPVFLWDHENGECVDLIADPVELLAVSVDSGIDWIDFYENGTLAVGRRLGSVDRASHLHWTRPLTLGGDVSEANVSIVERESHLAGHADLWKQLRDLPPGTELIWK